MVRESGYPASLLGFYQNKRRREPRGITLGLCSTGKSDIPTNASKKNGFKKKNFRLDPGSERRVQHSPAHSCAFIVRNGNGTENFRSVYVGSTRMRGYCTNEC